VKSRKCGVIAGYLSKVCMYSISIVIAQNILIKLYVYAQIKYRLCHLSRSAEANDHIWASFRSGLGISNEDIYDMVMSTSTKKQNIKLLLPAWNFLLAWLDLRETVRMFESAYQIAWNIVSWVGSFIKIISPINNEKEYNCTDPCLGECFIYIQS
jgi:hypothetical protein